MSHTYAQGILLKATDPLSVQSFFDSDWATCPHTRCSITCYFLLFGQLTVSRKSNEQSTVSRSSSEDEYRAMASTTSEVTWIFQLLEEMGANNLKPVTLHSDNQSALYIAKNQVFHDRTKHIEIDCHFTQDNVIEGLLQLSYLHTRHQLAYILTNSRPSPHFRELLSMLGMSPLPSSLSPNLRGDIKINPG